MRHRDFLIVLVLMLATWTLPARAETPTINDVSLSSSVPRHGRQTIRFQLVWSVKNPYDADEISIDGVFTSPSGRTHRVPAFYYENHDPTGQSEDPKRGWELRFTPEEIGSYLVRLFVQTANGKAYPVATLTFTSTPSIRTGFVRRQGRRFVLSSGKGFFPVGANRCWGDFREPGLYLNDMERLADGGANCLRVWLAPWWLPIEREPAVFDQKAAALLDAIMTKAEEKGLRIILCIEQHGNLQPRGKAVGRWPGHPYNAKNGGPCEAPIEFFARAQARRLFKNRLRYLTARWGYSTSLMAWDLFNEVELAGVGGNSFKKPPPSLAAWHVEMAEFLRRHDPFKHLITTSSDVRFQQHLLDEKAIDLLQLHIYEKVALTRMLANSLSTLAEDASVPILVGEYGTIHSAEDGRAVTRAIFASALTGAKSGALPWLQDIATPEALYPRFGTAQRFFDRANWSRNDFKPIRSPIAAEVTLRNAERKKASVSMEALGMKTAETLCVFAFSDDGQMRMPDIRYAKIVIPEVPPGSYVVEVWNPETGSVLGYHTVVSDNSSLLIELHEGPADIALIVERRAALPQ